MKGNAPKRKVFEDAVDLLTVEMAIDKAVAKDGIVYLPIDRIKPFHDHPFRLYEGDRLEDMVQSIKDHGVLNPVIVRRTKSAYEMLAGHNRANAAKLAGLKEVPAIVKDNLSDEEAYVYVIETNMVQRSFTDLLPSEKAAVLKERYEKVLYQRKKEEIISEIQAMEGHSGKGGHGDHLSKNRDSLGQEYELSGSSVARLLRINKLIPELKRQLDDGKIAFVVAVNLSSLSEEEQYLVYRVMEENGNKIKPKHVTEH